MADVLFISLLILSVILFIIGLSQIIGLGWALFLFDLLTHNTPGDYATAQKSFSGSKSAHHKLVGACLILTSCIVIFYLISELT